MKTNFDILNTLGNINVIQKDFPKEDYKAFNYIFLRNIIDAKPVITKRDEIIKYLLENEEKLERTDEEVTILINSKQEFIDFLKEDSGVTLFTVSLDSIKDKEYDIEVAARLINLQLITD